MKLVEWNEDKMAIGIELIDTQHKILLSIINKLFNSIESNLQHKELFNITAELIEYTRYHFFEEERLFTQVAYPKSDEHKEEHSKFIKEILSLNKKLISDVTSKNKSIVESADYLYRYLTEWFISHILGIDREYSEYIKS